MWNGWIRPAPKVAAMRRDLLDALLAAQAAKQPAVLLTETGTGRQSLLVEPDRNADALGELTVTDNLRQSATATLRDDKGTTVHDGDAVIFVQPFNPPLRMAIVGAVHIAQALAPMAALTGYDVTIIDPRHGFASETRFPGVTVVDDWPDEALDRFAPDSRTAIVTLTHDPKLDDPALHRALRSDAFYIGCLGSRRTHAARLERLTTAGFTDEEMARIHGPVGLNIGARSPAEIAVAIMGQVTETLRTAPETPRTAAPAEAA